MRCKCCNSTEAKWDGVDWYCSDCSDAWREALYELEDWDDEEYGEEVPIGSMDSCPPQREGDIS